MTRAFRRYKAAAEAVYDAKDRRDKLLVLAFPPGTNVIYFHGDHMIRAKVTSVLGHDRVRVLSRDGRKLYELSASRIEQVFQ